MQDKYKKYTTKDFADDAFFWVWVTEADSESMAFWEAFLEENPSKKQEIDAARVIIENLNSSQDRLPDKKVARLWEALSRQNPDLYTYSKEKQFSPSVPAQPYKQLMHWERLAAVLAGILVVAVALFQFQKQQLRVVSTGFSQVEKVLLPDSSHVVLNANTQISFKNNWDEGEREVWIKGEAYFTVRHLRQDKKFTVYTDGVNVEVLGTEFSVNNRNDKTMVVLNSGKVNLVMEGSKEVPEGMVMEPGDLVEYSSAADALVHKVVDPERYLSWTQNKLLFEEASLKEIAEVLESNFGYIVIFSSKNILSKRFTGSVPADQLDLLLQGISQVHDLKIQVKDTVITIEDTHEKSGKE